MQFESVLKYSFQGNAVMLQRVAFLLQATTRKPGKKALVKNRWQKEAKAVLAVINILMSAKTRKKAERKNNRNRVENNGRKKNKDNY